MFKNLTDKLEENRF